MSEAEIRESISKHKDPLLNKNFGELKFINNVEINKDRINIDLGITNPFDENIEKLKAEIIHSIKSENDYQGTVNLNFSVGILNHIDRQKDTILPKVKNTIAIASGKGGVGKSTVAVNLAGALSLLGANVGLIDADIYGPSIPIMLGINERPEVIKQDNKHKMLPVMQYGIKLMSIGFLMEDNSAVVWRGPMASSALKQFMSEVVWGDLDYLLFDMPPGTGDIALTLSQTIPLTGAVIVTTPQEISLSDARRGHLMFQKVNVPTLGIIENMSYFVNPDKTKEYIFGKGGGEKMGIEYDIPLLGEIPIATKIREFGDSGKPVVFSEPESDISRKFKSMSIELIKSINQRNSLDSDKPKLEILI